MFQEIQITAFQCECDICHHVWTSRKDVLPTHCPNRKCKNPTGWNKGKKSKPPMTIIKPKPDYDYAKQTLEIVEREIIYDEGFGE